MSEIDINAIKEQIKQNVKFGSKKPDNQYGGQSCGVPSYPIVLTSEELSLEITVGFHRNTLRNKELAYTLFLLVLDDLVLDNSKL